MVGSRTAGGEGVVWGVTDDDGSASKHFCRRVKYSQNENDLKSLKMNECTRGS